MGKSILPVNAAERLSVQQKFEEDFKSIEKQYDKKFEDLEARLESNAQVNEQHAENYTAARSDYLKSNLKLEAATARNSTFETEYIDLVKEYGTQAELSENTKAAT